MYLCIYIHIYPIYKYNMYIFVFATARLTYEFHCQVHLQAVPIYRLSSLLVFVISKAKKVINLL